MSYSVGFKFKLEKVKEIAAWIKLLEMYESRSDSLMGMTAIRLNDIPVVNEKQAKEMDDILCSIEEELSVLYMTRLGAIVKAKLDEIK